MSTEKVKLIPEHVTAARGLLRMTRDELGKAAGVSAQTIEFFENRRTVPREETVERIREALERRGIVFMNGDKPGVLLDRDKAIIPPGSG